MARRKSKLAKGWAVFADVFDLTVDIGTTINSTAASVLSFSDIDTAEGAIARERSEWAIRRVLLWVYPRVVPATPSLLGDYIFSAQLFTGSLDEVLLPVSAGPFATNFSPAVLEAMAHPLQLQMDSLAVHTQLPFDGDTLSVTAPGTSDDFGVAYKPPVMFFDIKQGFRLASDHVLGLFVSAHTPFDGDVYNLSFFGKALLTKVE